jgi:hypothetical protein
MKFFFPSSQAQALLLVGCFQLVIPCPHLDHNPCNKTFVTISCPPILKLFLKGFNFFYFKLIFLDVFDIKNNFFKIKKIILIYSEIKILF